MYGTSFLLFKALFSVFLRKLMSMCQLSSSENSRVLWACGGKTGNQGTYQEKLVDITKAKDGK
jgi:hypothetical protein